MKATLPAIVSCLVAWLTLAFLLRQKLLPAAHPDARSLHRSTVARGAGVAIWAGVAASAFWLPVTWSAALPMALVIAVSFWDDRRSLSVGLRLASHFTAAVAWLALTGLPSGLVVAPLVVLIIVWMANLYNFMDGSDGLAAAMTLVGFTAYSIVAWRVESAAPAFMLAVAAATVPFMIVNWPPARAFLGDVGAVPIGFLAAILGTLGWQADWWPAWFPPLVFLPFIVDATATLVRRLFAGERIWRAHRDHAYQRLVRMGLGHSGTLALYLALMMGTAGSAVAALLRAPATGGTLLAFWTGALLFMFGSVDRAWRMQGKSR